MNQIVKCVIMKKSYFLAVSLICFFSIFIYEKEQKDANNVGSDIGAALVSK